MHKGLLLTSDRVQPIIWKWSAERLRNAGDALALVAKYTDIPVPKVHYCGKDENDIMYLEVERTDGLDFSTPPMVDA